MSNPWTKKNPLMSMWLSSFNRSANMARGKATTEARRQANTLMTRGYEDMLRLWTGASTPDGKKKRRR